MAEMETNGGKPEDSPHLPTREADAAHVLADSKLGVATPADTAGATDEEALSQSKLGVANPGDPAGESDEQALADSKLGVQHDGPPKDQGGAPAPGKTGEPDRSKPA